MKTCQIRNCKKEILCKGICKTHYKNKYAMENREKIRKQNKQIEERTAKRNGYKTYSQYRKAKLKPRTQEYKENMKTNQYIRMQTEPEYVQYRRRKCLESYERHKEKRKQEMRKYGLTRIRIR